MRRASLAMISLSLLVVAVGAGCETFFVRPAGLCWDTCVPAVSSPTRSPAANVVELAQERSASALEVPPAAHAPCPMAR